MFFRHSNVQILKIFLLAPSALADHTLHLVGRAPKMNSSRVGDFGAIWLSRVSCSFENTLGSHFWVFFRHSHVQIP